MPKRLKVSNTAVAKGPGGELRAYAVLCHVNEGFEHILAQLKQLENSRAWRRVSKGLQLIVEETRAEVNFEMVEFLQERELAEWTRLGAARKRTNTRTKLIKE
jgi:hypothetical protein